MPRGIFKYGDGFVMLDKGSIRTPVHKEHYEKAGFQPAYDEVPTEADFAGVSAGDNVRGVKGKIRRVGTY